MEGLGRGAVLDAQGFKAVDRHQIRALAKVKLVHQRSDILRVFQEPQDAIAQFIDFSLRVVAVSQKRYEKTEKKT